MHAMHCRLPKNFVLEERLERYGRVIELDPSWLAGQWAQACYPWIGRGGPGTPCGPGAFREVRVDLGCGKGMFTAEAARREPDVLFVGIDFEPICIAYAAQKACEASLANEVLLSATGDRVAGLFGPGEVARLYLNFSTPFPRKKEAWQRLTHVDRLLEYRRMLGTTGEVLIKTDSQPFRDFTLTQLDLAGYEVLWTSDDARADRPDDPASEYEERLGAQGAKVLAIRARPVGETPADVRQTAPLSLVAYLPQNLEGLDYVPYGMNASVTNLRNREKAASQRAKRRR